MLLLRVCGTWRPRLPLAEGMSAGLLVLTGAIYLGVAVDQYLKGANGMVVVYLGYVIANAGFAWSLR